MLEEGLLPLQIEAPPSDGAGEVALDDDFERPIVHRVIPAAGQPIPTALGPRTIFELCSISDEAAAEVLGELAHEPAMQPQERPLVTRDAGITRASGCAYPANRWTPEREEQERQRRAKQKPPRPARQKFKMKGTRQWADQT